MSAPSLHRESTDSLILFTIDHMDLYLYLGLFPLTTSGKGPGYQATYTLYVTYCKYVGDSSELQID